MAAGVCLLQLLVFSLWTVRTSDAQLGTEEPSGILVVGGVQVNVDIPTRVGCREFIRCLGNGPMDSLEWRRFSLRGSLQTGGNRVITTEMADPDMDGIFSFISHLEFDPIELTDSGSFTCTIDSQGTHTARLRVEPDLAEISTTDHDISNRTIGKMMSIYCGVDSCIPELTIQLLRDDEVQATRVRRESGTEFMPQEDPFDLTVSADITGQYSCRVVGTFMGETFVLNEFFNITGTPQPQPTTAPPTQGTNGGGGGNRGAADKLHTSLAVVLLAMLMILPLILL